MSNKRTKFKHSCRNRQQQCQRWLRFQWDQSIVSRHKKTGPNNFRPILILPIPMKIFEKIVHDQVSVFVKGVVPRNFHNQKKFISYECWSVLRSLKNI